ncbi:hypothetical protein XENOCAPTIV_004071 [Xenoophorus captivus]|uniref:Secreted protein n=1 Tax=Xenoophorus captivus TaxID=1517983 RepID=A0ABV0S513_9TELE
MASEALIFILAASHTAANCSSESCRSQADEANRTTSSAKSRDGILRPPKRIRSTPWLRLEIQIQIQIQQSNFRLYILYFPYVVYTQLKQLSLCLYFAGKKVPELNRRSFYIKRCIAANTLRHKFNDTPHCLSIEDRQDCEGCELILISHELQSKLFLLLEV